MAIPAALPVVNATSGWRLPVTPGAANGKPVTVGSRGVPVVVVPRGGIPVVDISGMLSLGPNIGDWAAGASTELSIQNDRARATCISGSNPRISVLVTGLEPSAVYDFQTNIYPETMLNGVLWRVSATQNLDTGDYYNMSPVLVDTLVNGSFTAPASGEVYMGIVGVGGTGQFCETDETFTLTKAGA